MISVTHSGVGNVIELNQEHYRRLGKRYDINPDYVELMFRIKEKREKYNLPYAHIKKLLYFFQKSNEYISITYVQVIP